MKFEVKVWEFEKHDDQGCEKIPQVMRIPVSRSRVTSINKLIEVYRIPRREVQSTVL